MTETIQPTITDAQNERLLKLAWSELLLKLSDERAVAAQAELDENLDNLEDFREVNVARYRCAVYEAHLTYWQGVVADGYTPHAEQRR